MFYPACRLILLAVCLLSTGLSEDRLTFAAALPSVKSIQKYGQHVCNAVEIASELFVTSAACLVSSKPSELQLTSTKDSRMVPPKTQCDVTSYELHPKYTFLSHNIGVMEVKCGGIHRSSTRNTLMSDVKNGDYLTLVGVDKSLQKVNVRMKLQKCRVCQKEYAVFDCGRQICLKPVGKDIEKLQTIEVGSAEKITP